MIFDELEKQIKNKQVDILPSDPVPETGNPIEQLANPSLDEFLNTLIHLRTIRLGRLAIVKLPIAQNFIVANFKPTRSLRAFFLVKGKSSSTPVYVQFNGDSNLNYCYVGNPSVSKVILSGADTTTDETGIIDIVANEATSSKRFFWSLSRWSGAAASPPVSVTGVGGWENITSQITSIKLLPAGSETFATGSYLIVYGVD